MYSIIYHFSSLSFFLWFPSGIISLWTEGHPLPWSAGDEFSQILFI